MSQVPLGRLGPNATLAQIAAQTDSITEILNREVEFGDPQDPLSPTSTNLAGQNMDAADAHNGTPGNIAGSYVEHALEFNGTGTRTFTHNLYLNDPDYVLPDSSSPNVRWQIHGISHDGENADTTSYVELFLHYIGGALTANEIDLRFSLGRKGTLITLGSSHPLVVTVFFTKATRVIY